MSEDSRYFSVRVLFRIFANYQVVDNDLKKSAFALKRNGSKGIAPFIMETNPVCHCGKKVTCDQKTVSGASARYFPMNP